MTYDAAVPQSLRQAQEWFGKIISRAMVLDNQINPISPSGASIEEEAALYIAPSPTLRPAQRIQLYNQQYWWRLLNTLHEMFPLATRLFGYSDFNHTIAIPYLEKHPPQHWSLNKIGRQLPQWIEEHYTESDKTLVKDAIELDLAYNLSFFAPRHPPVSAENLPGQGDISSLLDKPLNLQPHIHLFEFKYDLFKVRTEMLEHPPEYWVEHDFPLLPKDKGSYHFVLFRNRANNIAYDTLSSSAFHILCLFRKGTTIEEVCHWIEEQDEKVGEEAVQHLHLWFQEWAFRQWLVESTTALFLF